MKKVKVAHIITKMDRGGMETFIMNVFNEIDREKIEFHFLVTTHEKGSYDDEIYELGGKIHRLPSPDKGINSYKKELLNLCKEENFDVMHSHVHYFSGVTLAVAKKANIPIRLAHSHNTSDGCNDSIIRKIYRAYMLHLINKSSTQKLACSKDAAMALFLKIDNKTQVINNGINLKKFQNIKVDKDNFRHELGIEENTFVIGNVARFEDQKNHFFLLKIFAEVVNLNPNVCLLLAGDGSLKSKIIEKSKELNIYDKIKFLGVRKDINNIMSIMDRFVFPSKYEGLGIAIVEAQSAGLRCIVSDKVPKEVDLTGNVEFLSLSDSSRIWAEEILQDKEVNEISDKMKAYDIREVSKQMLDIYTTQEK